MVQLSSYYIYEGYKTSKQYTLHLIRPFKYNTYMCSVAAMDPLHSLSLEPYFLLLFIMLLTLLA